MEDIFKNIFFEVKKKFDTTLGVFCKEKITIDPNDPAVVEQYAKFMKTVSRPFFRTSKNKLHNSDEDAGCTRCKELSIDIERIQTTLMRRLWRWMHWKKLREIKKLLLRYDEKGIALRLAEFDKINKKSLITNKSLLIC
ncbi:hypothetical protein EJ110_NYTH35144 [Nymphaea thermarum]|nr:hypothetical protein EJ110_NYTH35144 [Nymphaea thermarum]